MVSFAQITSHKGPFIPFSHSVLLRGEPGGHSGGCYLRLPAVLGDPLHQACAYHRAWLRLCHFLPVLSDLRDAVLVSHPGVSPPQETTLCCWLGWVGGFLDGDVPDISCIQTLAEGATVNKGYVELFAIILVKGLSG